MKGIVLAGGVGTRLYPATVSCCKQLLAVYDKPMIYYPLSTLMLANIRDILIISTPRDISSFKELLGDGEKIGLNLSYKVQDQPRGIAEAFILGEEHIGNSGVCLILGDNLFYGYAFTERLISATSRVGSATIFGYHVANPQDFGVVEFDMSGKVLSLEEKPTNPKSNYVVPGLYFYDNNVVNIAKTLTLSARGEFEITDVNNVYLRAGKLCVELLGRGTAWLDTGSPRALLDAANFVEAIQSRQGLYIACLEEIAFHKGFISKEQLLFCAEKFKTSDYGRYLRRVAENGREK